MGNVNVRVDQKEPSQAKNAKTKLELKNVRHERRSVRKASHSEKNVERRVENVKIKLSYEKQRK